MNLRLLLRIFCLIGILVGILLPFSPLVRGEEGVLPFLLGIVLVIGFGTFATVLYVFDFVAWSNRKFQASIHRERSTSGPEVSPKSEEVHNDGLIDHVNSDEPMGGKPKT